jgi:hypothetical protein
MLKPICYDSKSEPMRKIDFYCSFCNYRFTDLIGAGSFANRKDSEFEGRASSIEVFFERHGLPDIPVFQIVCDKCHCSSGVDFVKL